MLGAERRGYVVKVFVAEGDGDDRRALTQELIGLAVHHHGDGLYRWLLAQHAVAEVEQRFVPEAALTAVLHRDGPARMVVV